MKKYLVFVAYLALCILEVHGQGMKKVLKSAETALSKPSYIVRLRVPTQIRNGALYQPIEATILPYQRSFILGKEKIRGYRYLDYPFPRPLQENDLIKFHLFPSAAPFKDNTGILITNSEQHLKFHSNAANTIYFPFKTDNSFSAELGSVNMFFTATVNNDPYLTLSKDFSVKTLETSTRGRHEETLFEDSIKLKTWKNIFETFLKESNINFSFNTKLNNKVSQAFYSFCKRWEKMHLIDKVKGDAGVRFLTSCGLACEAVNPRTYSAWFLKYYKDETKLLYNEDIDIKVENWFVSHGLK